MNSLGRHGVTTSGQRSADADKPAGASRRGFIKVAAAAGLAQISTSLLNAAPREGHAASGESQTGAGESQAVPGRQHFPAPLPAISPIEGLFDTHAHTAPDVRERSLDDVQALQLYRDQSMGGVVLKCHVAPTADRAFLASQRVPGIKVFGGVVLNYSVGGINPTAVQWMWRMKGGCGRMVWFPTMDSDYDVKHSKQAEEGIKVVGPDGKVLPAVIEVLKICAKQKLVVNTGHSSPNEGLAIIAAARDVGADRNPRHSRPNRSSQYVARADEKSGSDGCQTRAGRGGPHGWPLRSRLREGLAAGSCAGDCRCHQSRRCGEFRPRDRLRAGHQSPTHADGLAWFVTELMAQGISKEQIMLMWVERIPARC